jgi:hypothetical protein
VSSLGKAGLTIQLGHDGQHCPWPTRHIVSIILVNHNGPHDIKIKFCDCRRVETAHASIQLLCAGWWPATTVRPKTAIDICTLKQFHALMIQGKLTAYDYWESCACIVSGSGTCVIKVLYNISL